ncbi:signal peptidase I [Mucilaginibacter mallensis]|uniref:Signal peptidase I n=1 Tax=Mucilaginibacter mallensis TaxID=652787 RepID=A0A1H2B290_MUCMA|nr:signal peptidase I [Mucilaginibacter mallensis]SDT52202.1 signal peptidase I [Mucilaginibacter mallensis]
MKLKVLRPFQFALLLKYFLIIVALSIICRIFLLEIFFVPTNSMKQTLFPGDIVLVAKWQRISLNDVAVFRDPFDMSKFLIKRCVGYPGQNLRLAENKLIVNGIIQRDDKNLRYKFEIVANPTDLQTFLNKERLKEDQDYEIESLGFDRYSINCNERVANQLKDLKTVKSFGRLKIVERLPVRSFYFEIGNRQWTASDMGPIFLPKKGETIEVNDTTYQRYKDVINAYEDAKISKLNDYFIINHKRVSTYTFKNDYYFFLGDNRQASEDSRIFGPVPDRFITGKSVFLLFNTHDRDRFLKSIL